MTPFSSTFLSVAGISALSLVGTIPFLFFKKQARTVLLYLVSFSVGALLGDAFLHIIPELAEGETLSSGIPYILGGMLVSFGLEKIIHWHHCHVLPPQHPDCHNHIGYMNLFGDAVHNFIDGAIIAASFLVSPSLGMATTIAVALHEIPQEIGDFAVLLHSGFTRKRAILWNIFAALCAFVGAGIILFTSVLEPFIETALLPFAAGNFIYIAAVDLIPELHKETRLKQAFVQLISILCGVGIMYLLTLAE